MSIDPIEIAKNEVKRRMGLYAGLAVVLVITGQSFYASHEHSKAITASLEILAQKDVISKLQQQLRDQDASYQKQLADQAYSFTARLVSQNAAIDTMNAKADKQARQAIAAVAALDKANQASAAHVNELINMKRPAGVTGCDNAERILNEETERK